MLFDLDGVLTDTAKVHAACWKKMFDEFLRKWAESRGEEFRSFSITEDYYLYVDGRLRSDGVRYFLRSRNINLPEGDPDAPPESETVSGLGNRKNDMVNALMESEGIDVYPDSVAWVRLLREQGYKTAVVSASSNCKTVLNSANILDLFDTIVDGTVAADLGLEGKPSPDTYLNAAEQLGAEPKRTVVVEDAISGVQAGRSGGFGLVIGVARKGNIKELKENGADLVVTDLSELIQ
ncbi:MAG: beta-phosphoglucomutase family hydrolase [Deltaproteobacteria bacterium]|nr:beta-phosphoglucomutase family hydrolase [Deltaproteobacteria bacterium]MCK5186309.1 beta-phosphoglucomutase family hydrolase [Deltaproteobacteria bacterium]